MDIEQLQEGAILKMEVASRSHVTQPYYVEVISFDGKELVIGIPGKHKLDMVVGSGTWDYQFARMSYIGTKSEYHNLLLNQKFT